MSGLSAVWDDTDGCSKQYMCALAVYLMTVLSSSYSIIKYRAINSTVYRNNFVDGHNATDKRYLKEQIELIGVLASFDTSSIGILSSDSEDVSINFSDQRIHILNIK